MVLIVKAIVTSNRLEKSPACSRGEFLASNSFWNETLDLQSRIYENSRTGGSECRCLPSDAMEGDESAALCPGSYLAAYLPKHLEANQGRNTTDHIRTLACTELTAVE